MEPITTTLIVLNTLALLTNGILITFVLHHIGSDDRP